MTLTELAQKHNISPANISTIIGGRVLDNYGSNGVIAMETNMNDIRLELPECPLEYEVPFIPGNPHTALVIPVNAADINWQERMLPWTLASLINNTDIVIQGVHIYVLLAPGIKGFRDRIQNALKNFDLPDGTITEDGGFKIREIYETTYIFNINHWAFRDSRNQIKLPIEQLWFPDIIHSGYASSKKPQLCNMQYATKDIFCCAIKHLMAAQLAMEI